MTQMLAKKDRIRNIRGMLTRSQEQIAMALPKHMNADRMLRVAMTSIQRTPKLLECSPESLVGAVIESAQLGLEPDSMTGEAYLVPYGNKCTLIPGYKGLLTLARRSGQVKTIYAHCVHEKDEFRYELGLRPDLIHIPSGEADRGEVTHVYAVALLEPDGHHFEVMSRAQVEAIRSSSKAGRSGPWVTHWDEMARKTVLRRVCKYLTLSPEMNRAVSLEDRHDAGVIEVGSIGIVPDIETVEASIEEPVSQLDQLADAIEGEIVEEPETDPDGRKANPKTKAKPKKLSAAKRKAIEKRIDGNSAMLPADVRLAVEDHFGNSIANLTTDQEADVIGLLESLGV